MPSHRIHLHSQNREGKTTANNAIFSLSKAINNVRSIAVKHCILANECFNIMAGQNTINVELAGYPSSLVIPAGFYSPIELAFTINNVFQSYDDLSSTYVSLATDGRSLLWTLPVYVRVVEGGSGDIYIGLNETSTGSFSTTPYLGAPHSVAFVCPQFDHIHSIIGGVDNGTRPFFILPLTNGFGQHEISIPQQLFYIRSSATALDQIRVKLVDPASGLFVNVNHWSLELEIESEY
jgi:hypothetical protein